MPGLISLVLSAMICLLPALIAKPPVSVLNAFSQRFPLVKNVKWSKENEYEYEASFRENGVELSANYTVDGTWLETEKEINADELPLKVLSTFNTTHQGVKMKEVCTINRNDGTTEYEIEFNHGSKKVEIIYLEDGSLKKS